LCKQRTPALCTTPALCSKRRAPALCQQSTHTGQEHAPSISSIQLADQNLCSLVHLGVLLAFLEHIPASAVYFLAVHFCLKE